jgi:hypothetical protein
VARVLADRGRSEANRAVIQQQMEEMSEVENAEQLHLDSLKRKIKDERQRLMIKTHGVNIILNAGVIHYLDSIRLDVDADDPNFVAQTPSRSTMSSQGPRHSGSNPEVIPESSSSESVDVDDPNFVPDSDPEVIPESSESSPSPRPGPSRKRPREESEEF